MDEQLQEIERSRSRLGFVFFCLIAVGMIVLLGVASFTSAQGFKEIYIQVAVLLSLSKNPMSLWLFDNPEFGHLLVYALLSLALSGMLSRQRIFIAPMIASFVGLLMEGVQIFVPTRQANFMDVGFNILGVVFGFGVYLLGVGVVRGLKKFGAYGSGSF